MADRDFSDILKTEPGFRYRLLGRMQSDCEYYLHHGNRFAGHLWAHDESDQIKAMEALWDSFPDTEKPEWLSRDQIRSYGVRMGVYPFQSEPGHVRALLIPVYEPPREISISKVDSLEEMQQLVDGLIQPVDVLGDGITLYVNKEGLFTQPANRALYATKGMEEAGYLSQLDYSNAVKEGELYGILMGNIVAVSYDEDMELQDLTQEQVESLTEQFKDTESGRREAILLARRLDREASAREEGDPPCAGADLMEARSEMSDSPASPHESAPARTGEDR